MTTATSTELQHCIQNCQDCYRVCEETKIHCLQQGGRHAEPAHMSLLADCARICALSADFMIRHSERHRLTCSVCGAICEACAEECSQMRDDPEMQRCAEACQRCAESCKEMANAHHM